MLQENRSRRNPQFEFGGLLEQYAKAEVAYAHKPKVKLVLPLPKPQAPANGAKYGIGQRVRTRLTPEPLTVVEADVYGPNAQFYMLSHEDGSWVLPQGVSVNTNYDRPRILASMGDIVEAVL